MNYGLPYKGSKGGLAETIIKILPSGGRLVDMFGGGGAVTHCASMSHKRPTILYNELDTGVYNLFSNIHNIDVEKLKKRFVTRQEFIDIRDKEIHTPEEDLILLCWSFGNNQKGYLYGKDIEERKHRLHNLHFRVGINNQQELDEALEGLSQSRIYFDKYRIFYRMSYDEYCNCKYFRADLKKYIDKRIDIDGEILDDNELRYWINDKKKKENFQLESLERLESLQRLESLESLEYSNLSYEDIPLQEGDILYCDPPYEGTDGYRVGGFDHKKFREFVRTTPYPCYVSSYKGPEELLYLKTTKSQKLNKSKDNSKQTEMIYRNIANKRIQDRLSEK